MRDIMLFFSYSRCRNRYLADKIQENNIRRFEAAELDQPLLCAVCRGEGRFVVMKEVMVKEQQHVDKEG